MGRWRTEEGRRLVKIESLPTPLSVCKVARREDIDLARELTFVGITDEELSLVCPTEFAPASTVEREDGWRAMRIEGVRDFSLVGILAKVSAALADKGIGIFAVSTYNTDYVLVKEQNLEAALAAVAEAGFEIG